MTNEGILNKLKEVLGSSYDSSKEEMYLQVYKHVEMENLKLLWEPMFFSKPLRISEGVDWSSFRITNALNRRVGELST